ncbi:MAG: SDR family oxidoreductase [Clostridia bacterium]|nr:SDR family oxidoreductase [Clostridia bacterium]
MTGNAERRVALVTGGGKGVGAGIVRVLAARGIRCCMGCNSNPAMAEEARRAIEAAGGEAFMWQADVADPAKVREMVDAVIDRWGRLDILVNNAAMQLNRFIDEYSYATLRRLWQINIGGYFHAARAALPYLRDSDCPRIVNISSIHGKRPTSFDVGYAMTKGAIRMFTRELSLELFADGITVNAVDLGGCKIEFKTGNAPIRLNTPIECCNPDMPRMRMVTPEDVGELVWFLCSPGASSITGSAIRLDKGLVLT